MNSTQMLRPERASTSTLPQMESHERRARMGWRRESDLPSRTTATTGSSKVRIRPRVAYASVKLPAIAPRPVALFSEIPARKALKIPMIVGMTAIKASVIPHRNHVLLVSLLRSLSIGPERLSHVSAKIKCGRTTPERTGSLGSNDKNFSPAPTPCSLRIVRLGL
jgi:hypothetical protein